MAGECARVRECNSAGCCALWLEVNYFAASFFDEPIFADEQISFDQHKDGQSDDPRELANSQFGVGGSTHDRGSSREGLQSAMEANEFRVISETIRNARTRRRLQPV